MGTQSGKSRSDRKPPRLRAAARTRLRRIDRTPSNAWLDSGLPALIGGFAAAGVGGLSLVPAAGVAAAAGLGYTLLRIRNQQG